MEQGHTYLLFVRPQGEAKNGVWEIPGIYQGKFIVEGNQVSVMGKTQLNELPPRDVERRRRFDPRHMVRAAAYHAAGGMTFYHASEHKIEHMQAQADTGIQVLWIGPGADLAEAKRTVDKRVCLLGNLDPIEALLQGSAEDVTEQSRRILALGEPGGGYIFNSGEMIPRDTPIENMRAMARAAGKNV